MPRSRGTSIGSCWSKDGAVHTPYLREMSIPAQLDTRVKEYRAFIGNVR